MNASSTGMKRQAPATFSRMPFYHTLPVRHMSADAAYAKRRRLKDELQYTAATIQQALENAGRPPLSLLTCRARALTGSVSTDSCMVISSTEYDASAAASAVVVTDSITAADDDNDYSQDRNSDVDEMLVYASLIQSTRQFYRFGDDTASLVNPKESINNDKDDGQGNDDDDDEEIRASSDTTSTWTPTSICNQVNLNDKKTIDNENRSDGMSSNPSSSAYGEEETSDISFSDQCEGADSSPSPVVPEKEERRSLNGTLFGNENNCNDDLYNNDNNTENNNGHMNNDTTPPEGRSFFVIG
jgi:hypothetical protein